MGGDEAEQADQLGLPGVGDATAGHDGGRGDESDEGARGAKRAPSAYNAALNLLAVRDFSRAELSGRLASRGFEAEAIESAILRLEEAHLLNEEAYAANFAASRAARGVAATVIRRDLAAKGVDADLAARAAAEASPADDDAARCRELAGAWLAKRPGLTGEVAARRLAGYLARRGYPSGLVARIVWDLTETDATETDSDSESDDV